MKLRKNIITTSESIVHHTCIPHISLGTCTCTYTISVWEPVHIPISYQSGNLYMYLYHISLGTCTCTCTISVWEPVTYTISVWEPVHVPTCIPYQSGNLYMYLYHISLGTCVTLYHLIYVLG